MNSEYQLSFHGKWMHDLLTKKIHCCKHAIYIHSFLLIVRSIHCCQQSYRSKRICGHSQSISQTLSLVSVHSLNNLFDHWENEQRLNCLFLLLGSSRSSTLSRLSNNSTSVSRRLWKTSQYIVLSFFLTFLCLFFGFVQSLWSLIECSHSFKEFDKTPLAAASLAYDFQWIFVSFSFS